MNTAEMVEDEGFNVVQTRTVEDAYDFLSRYSSLRLVLTDLETPGNMDGCQLAWEVSKRWPHICVVLASNSGRPPVGSLPPNAIFVAKPLSPDVVHEAIEEYCGNCDLR